MPDSCKHFWIDYGKIIKGDGEYDAEYRCDICGKVVFTPLPPMKKKPVEAEKYEKRRGRKKKENVGVYGD